MVHCGHVGAFISVTHLIGHAHVSQGDNVIIE